jgi:hypothetical protein
LLPGKLRPRTSLICVVAIMIAAADVKPTDTGPEMKSIKNPEKQISFRLRTNSLH